MNIWSHICLKLINDETITTYCLSPLKFVYDNLLRNARYSHTLACDCQLLNIFRQCKSEDEKNKMLELFNTYNQMFQSKQGIYGRGHIWTGNLPDYQLPHIWYQQHSLGDTQFWGEVACRLTSKIV